MFSKRRSRKSVRWVWALTIGLISSVMCIDVPSVGCRKWHVATSSLNVNVELVKLCWTSSRSSGGRNSRMDRSRNKSEEMLGIVETERSTMNTRQVSGKHRHWNNNDPWFLWVDRLISLYFFTNGMWHRPTKASWPGWSNGTGLSVSSIHLVFPSMSTDAYEFEPVISRHSRWTMLPIRQSNSISCVWTRSRSSGCTKQRRSRLSHCSGVQLSMREIDSFTYTIGNAEEWMAVTNKNVLLPSIVKKFFSFAVRFARSKVSDWYWALISTISSLATFSRSVWKSFVDVEPYQCLINEDSSRRCCAAFLRRSNSICWWTKRFCFLSSFCSRLKGRVTDRLVVGADDAEASFPTEESWSSSSAAEKTREPCDMFYEVERMRVSTGFTGIEFLPVSPLGDFWIGEWLTWGWNEGGEKAGKSVFLFLQSRVAFIINVKLRDWSVCLQSESICQEYVTFVVLVGLEKSNLYCIWPEYLFELIRK